MLQYIATYRNRVAKRTQHVVPNNVARCCVEMLRAFGQDLRLTSSEFPRLAEALRISEMFTCCNINVIGTLVNRAKEICLSLPFQTNISRFCDGT